MTPGAFDPMMPVMLRCDIDTPVVARAAQQASSDFGGCRNQVGRWVESRA